MIFPAAIAPTSLGTLESHHWAGQIICVTCPRMSLVSLRMYLYLYVSLSVCMNIRLGAFFSFFLLIIPRLSFGHQNKSTPTVKTILNDRIGVKASGHSCWKGRLLIIRYAVRKWQTNDASLPLRDRCTWSVWWSHPQTLLCHRLQRLAFPRHLSAATGWGFEWVKAKKERVWWGNRNREEVWGEGKESALEDDGKGWWLRSRANNNNNNKSEGHRRREKMKTTTT